LPRKVDGRSLDGRSSEARRFKELLAGIIADVAPDGPHGLTEAQRQLARRATLLCVQCERLESLAVSGAVIDVDHYGTLTDRLGRCLARLGLKDRVPRDDGEPSLSEYLATAYASGSASGERARGKGRKGRFTTAAHKGEAGTS
jgi:hypothetical protein